MTTANQGRRESFQPVAVRSPTESPLLFALRCLIDLQLSTIDRFLRTRLGEFSGRVLDVGAGQSPWRHLLGQIDYVGIDVEDADRFGMQPNASILYYDGRSIPFPDASFDHVLCVEVLEHVEEPLAFLREIARVLRVDGSLVLTVPWSARIHHVPHDYHRFTHYALTSMLTAAGFGDIEIVVRGDDVAVIANKLIVVVVRLWRSKRGLPSLWRWPLALLLVPVAFLAIAAAHCRSPREIDATQDPLGYGVHALRR